MTLIEQRKIAEEKREFVGELFGKQPNMRPAEIQRAVREKFKSGIDLTSIYRARRNAHKTIDEKTVSQLPRGFVRDVLEVVAPIIRTLNHHRVLSVTIRHDGPVTVERVVSEEIRLTMKPGRQ